MVTDNTQPVTLTDQNFQQNVMHNPQPVLVDFWATWCGPCQTMNPIIKDLAEEFSGQITVGKVNVDEHPQLVGHYRIQSIPTFLVLKNGQVVDQLVGSVSKHLLAEKLKAALQAA